MPPTKLHTILIEKLVPGGLGLGRLDEGIVVLVRYVLPGEKVVVHEDIRRKDYISATLKEVLSPSPDRIEPPCPVYGSCGGCDLQHAAYDVQIHLKTQMLIDCLARAAGNSFAQRAISPALPTPQQFGYRQRLRFQVDGEGNYGFFQAASHILAPVSQCLLARDELHEVLYLLQSSDAFKMLVKHCIAFELLYNPNGNNTVMLLKFSRKPRPADCLCAANLTADTRGKLTILMQVQGYGFYDPEQRAFLANPPTLSHTLALEAIHKKLVLSWEAGSFCQVNLRQNNNLVNEVMDMISGGPHDRVLDLYCGHGNFSLPAAQLAGDVLGIDLQNAAIRMARHNTVQNQNNNCTFEKNQVPTAVRSLLAAGRKFETIILDPPRQGAAGIVPMLAGLHAEQVVYISCDPATLARDLASLVTAGYQLSRLVPVDMFPQTHHLESVALLKQAAR